MADGTVFTLDVPQFVAAFGHRPTGVRHSLADHPLLSLDAIAELADRFPGRIERHSGDLPMVLPGGAPELEGKPSDTVRGIEENGCWMVFWFLELDPEYKALLNQILDEVDPYLPRDAGGMIKREAFLFLSSPNAVTPVHFDHEHNFLLQIRGRKDMHVCPFPDVESECRELERLYDGGEFLDRNLGAVPPKASCSRSSPAPACTSRRSCRTGCRTVPAPRSRCRSRSGRRRCCGPSASTC
jgi:hypothetical protein